MITRVLKDTDSHALRRAKKAAAAGQMQLSPQAAARLLREVRHYHIMPFHRTCQYVQSPIDTFAKVGPE